MTTKLFSIAADKLDELFELIASKADLYYPQDDAEGKSDYKPYKKGAALSKGLNTKRSAKDFFFPQIENYVNFTVEGKSIEIKEQPKCDRDFVIFGVRACDVKSFSILDTVFLNEPVDGYYKARREHAITVTSACNRPAETCFCTTLGIDPVNPDGDVSSWCANGKYYFTPNTDKGIKFIEMASELLVEADWMEIREFIDGAKKVFKKLPLKDVDFKKFFSDKTMMERYNDPRWAEIYKTCLACGTCTYVCPTCQCYDIKEFKNGNDVIRYRCWDSCMYSDFTKMSAGQPRPTQLERFRQRFMHKLVYYPMNNQGTPGCVGCGRCLASCPISMNIVKVAKKLQEEEIK